MQNDYEVSKELSFLLMLIRDEDAVSSFDDELSATLNWQHVIELALHHRIYPLLYVRLKKWVEQGFAVPEGVLQGLNALYMRNTFQMLQLSGEMERLNRALNEQQIRTLFLKGPVLAADLYGDISMRTSCDLDILVPIEQLARTESLLLSLGYKKDDYIHSVLGDWKWRHHHVAYYHDDKQMKVEIHWRLNPGPAKEPSFELLWAQKRQSQLLHDPIYILGQEHLFLFLITHGARHGWSRLRWLLDIDQMMKGALDASAIQAMLKTYQVSQLGGQALKLIEQLLQRTYSGEWHRLLATKRAEQLALEAMFYVRQMVNLHTLPLPDHIALHYKKHVIKLMSKRQWTLFMLSCLYPYAEDVNTLPLPKPLHVLYFVLRPILWAWRKTKKHALS